MKPLTIGLVVVSLFICSIAGAQEKFSKVKIYTTSIQERNELVGLLQIDHFIPERNAIISEISARELNVLRTRNVKFDILVDDVSQNLERLNRKYFADRAAGIEPEESHVAFEQSGKTVDAIIQKPAAFQVKTTFGGYYSFSEMVAAMDTLVKNYPNIASKTSIGKTAQGRDLWLIKISDNVATDETGEPEVIYLGLQHAREAITGASMIFFMQYLCEFYYKDTRVKNLVDNREIYIVPCFNPDGWEYNRLNGGAGSGWRKNRRFDSTVTIKSIPGKKGAPTTYDTTVTYDYYGVDLNRNWGQDWGNCSAPILGSPTSCGSNVKTDETYYGPGPFSELENQAVRAFTKAHHIVAGFDQHSYGPYYSLPFGRKIAGRTMSVKGQNFYTTIPALMGTYNGMRAADSYDALGYEVAGGFKDWMLMGELGVGTKDTVWAMTGEGAAGGGTGGTYGSFWAPASQIVYLSKGMCYQNLQLAYAAGTYVDIQDGNDIALAAKTGNLKFIIKRLGIGNDPVTVTLVPLENMQSIGTPVTVNSIAYYDTYVGNVSYTLPSSISNGQRVRYAWKITTGNYTYSDTITRFYNPATLFSDDMEGASVATYWTVSGGWNYATDKAYAGAKSLTESPGGNYTGNLNLTATYNKTLDLSNANGAYLTFMTRYRAENFRDKLQVQVTTTPSVSTSWMAIPGKYTIQEPGTVDGSTINGQPSLTGIHDYWVQEVFDLSGYNGQSALSMRFAFTSDSDPSSFKYEVDEGFYIDNLSVIKSTATFGTLPVTISSFTGKLLPGNAVKLTWEAAADKVPDYFEIERSRDGIHFGAIGKITVPTPYTYTDAEPISGNNFYRIRQVDKEGHATYSKVILIVLQDNFRVRVSPNPVLDQAYINLYSQASEHFKIQIADLQGRVVYKNEQLVTAAATLVVNMQSWPAQLYVLKIINSKNEVVATQKIVRL